MKNKWGRQREGQEPIFHNEWVFIKLFLHQDVGGEHQKPVAS